MSLISIIILTQMQKIKGKQQWTQKQKKLLAELYPKYSSKKWKMISLQMTQNGFKRSQLQCRQKWINFLDPNLNKQEWSENELQMLYGLHDRHGTRWCFMQKELNRTQNKIKNRFYGTIRNYVRLIMNTLCERNNRFNAEINKISPNLLNDLYNSQNIFDFLGGEVRKMIFRMKFKIEKKVLRNRIRDRQHLYKELIGLLASLFKGSFNLRILDRIQDQTQSQDPQKSQEVDDELQNEKYKLITNSISIKRQEIYEKQIEEQNNQIQANQKPNQSNQKSQENDALIYPFGQDYVFNNIQQGRQHQALEFPYKKRIEVDPPLKFLQSQPLLPQQLQLPFNPFSYNPSHIDFNMQALMMNRMKHAELMFGLMIPQVRDGMRQPEENMQKKSMNQSNQQ